MTDQSNPANAPADHAVIEVTTSFFFLAFLLFFCKTVVALNGRGEPQSWGTTAIPVPPGRYTVEAWCKYFVAPEMGRNGVVVDAAPGTVTRIRWKAPFTIWGRGAMDVTSVEPLAGGAAMSAPISAASAAPGGWHPDPSGRHEQRYFDGTQWTEHVTTAGVAGTDPMGDPT